MLVDHTFAGLQSALTARREYISLADKIEQAYKISKLNAFMLMGDIHFEEDTGLPHSPINGDIEIIINEERDDGLVTILDNDVPENDLARLVQITTADSPAEKENLPDEIIRLDQFLEPIDVPVQVDIIAEDKPGVDFVIDVDQLAPDYGQFSQRISEICQIFTASLNRLGEMADLLECIEKDQQADLARLKAEHQKKVAELQKLIADAQIQNSIDQTTKRDLIDNARSQLKNNEDWMQKWWLINKIPFLFPGTRQKIRQLQQRIADNDQQIQIAEQSMRSYLEWQGNQVNGLQSAASNYNTFQFTHQTAQIHSLTAEFRRMEQRDLRSLLPECKNLTDEWLNIISRQLLTWYPDWESPVFQNLQPQALVRDGPQLVRGLRVGRLIFNESIPSIPAILDPFSQRKHVFIHGGINQNRTDILQQIVARSLLAFPIGMINLILVDSAELGNALSQFRTHLGGQLTADKVYYLETEISELFGKIRDRMAQISQHVLVTPGLTLDDHNRDNPDMMVPYQIIVVSNFPNGFSDQALTILLDHILLNGPRCGVFVVFSVSDRLPDQRNFSLTRFLENNYVLKLESPEIISWNHERQSGYQVRPDTFLPAMDLNHLLTTVSDAYKLKPSLIAYERIQSKLPSLWSGVSLNGFFAPIGLTFSGKLHQMEFSDQLVHALIGGRTGSGKTKLIHNLVCSLALVYGPDELQFYLLDFKGTEFDVFAKSHLPHARVVAVDCDPEIGLNVIKDLETEMDHRKRLFTEIDAEDIRTYRSKGGKMPRILLIIDEVQALAEQTNDLNLTRKIESGLVNLLLRGRAMGIHVLIGTQSPSNVLSPQMLQQIVVRVCMGADEHVSRLVLGGSNDSAASLTRQGEAFYNTQNGRLDANVMLRAALLEKDQEAVIIGNLYQEAVNRGMEIPSLIYFDGRSRSKLLDHPLMKNLFYTPLMRRRAMPTNLVMFGNAIGPTEDISAKLGRERYGNLLLLGGDGKALHGVFCNALLGLCLQHTSETANFFVIDLTFDDQPFAESTRAFSAMPHSFQFAENSSIGSDLITAVHRDLGIRKEQGREGVRKNLSIFLAIFGAENFSDLRSGDLFAPTESRKRLIEILRDGPSLGIHVILSTQTLAKGEIIKAEDFGLRVCCLGTAEEDSRQLLDSDAATKMIREHRGIYRNRSWGMGRLDKFKLYIPPTPEEIRAVADRLVQLEEEVDAHGTGN